ncbi:MAG: gfo/Idh/MocA family oxidoreductase [Calditrichaeota bacterium]|nr:MAG: gfo/Idh/MocA family oxidoreductase [Calditrichota bacterium]
MNMRIGVIMNGVTGRMGTHQHLLRSIVEIIKQGGVKISADRFIIPDPILVGRDSGKLQALCQRSGVPKYSTDLETVLADEQYSIYFDASMTGVRAQNVKKAIAAGKHIYCEKPTATNTAEAIELYRLAENAGLKHGVVQDKLWLPGLIKLRRLIEYDFLGRIFSIKGDFGYWVFEGFTVPPQRPSWNYRKQDDGGIIVDMLCHWRYILDHLFAKVVAVSCLGATHIPRRMDESGRVFDCTADDTAYVTFELQGGIIAHFNCSWATRVRRDDLLTIQVDGEKGSAVAGLHKCWTQHYGNTPRPVWNPDIEQPINYFADWIEVPDQEFYDNAFKAQWELYLRHVALEESFPWNLLEGAKGVQLAEKGLESWRKRAWVAVDEIDV